MRRSDNRALALETARATGEMAKRCGAADAVDAGALVALQYAPTRRGWRALFDQVCSHTRLSPDHLRLPVLSPGDRACPAPMVIGIATLVCSGQAPFRQLRKFGVGDQRNPRWPGGGLLFWRRMWASSELEGALSYENVRRYSMIEEKISLRRVRAGDTSGRCLRCCISFSSWA